MRFSPASCPFTSQRSKYSLKHPFSNTLNLCSFLYVRDQVSHPYKTTGKTIVVLYGSEWWALTKEQVRGCRNALCCHRLQENNWK
jgi:hypothetical protein